MITGDNLTLVFMMQPMSSKYKHHVAFRANTLPKIVLTIVFILNVKCSRALCYSFSLFYSKYHDENRTFWRGPRSMTKDFV